MNQPESIQRPVGKATRRNFLQTTAALVAGTGMAGLLEVSPVDAQAPAAAPAELQSIGQLTTGSGKILRATIAVKNERRLADGVKLPPGVQAPMMRYFEGKTSAGASVWPPNHDASQPGAALPGPTLRAAVGDRVELAFLNMVNTAQFPGGSIDNAEIGLGNGCDNLTNATVTPPVKNWYPTTRGDDFPNCFHGSSTANLHFHGTHVTPGTFGDNVLVQIRPIPATTAASPNWEKSVNAEFDKIFKKFETSEPANWKAVEQASGPAGWTAQQKVLLDQYDKTAPWQGGRGLPPKERLAPKNEALVAAGQWPEFFIGSYPTTFEITEAGKPLQIASNMPGMNHTPIAKKGQMPGTHWYHAHKHGSTAINLFNGLSGAFIIEGDYDKGLKKIYPAGLVEHVMVVQNITDLPSLERANRVGPTVVVNGQNKPKVTMKPNEVQLWRIVNGTVNKNIPVAFVPVVTTSPAVQFVQTAQDGVQLHPDNFASQLLLKVDSGNTPILAPGNRIDILVKAPATPGATYTFGTGVMGLSLLVGTGDANMNLPSASDYATNLPFPAFMTNISPDDIHIYRTLDFGWEPGRVTTGTGANNTGTGPHFTINNKQFAGEHFDETMVLGDSEEWTLYNSTSIPHPFHIHINPFQVVEIFNPNVTTQPVVPTANPVWADVIAIPPALLDTNGNVVLKDGKPAQKGYVKIRQKFEDFAGAFVLHCHILAHEDRGMMQLVQVIDPVTMHTH